MKRFITILLSVLCVACALFGSACNQSDPSNEQTQTQRPASDVLDDPTFQRGLNIGSLNSADAASTPWLYSGVLPETTQPAWKLAQYCDLSKSRGDRGYDSSKNNLQLPTIFDDTSNGGFGIEGREGSYYTLTNESGSKKVLADPANGSIRLEVNTKKEYVDQSTNVPEKRVKGEDWVHLTLRQGAGGITLADHAHVYAEITVTVYDYVMYNNDIGNSQFQWIFSVKDRQSSSGDYFWCNLTFFTSDCLGTVTESKGHLDSGSKDDSTGKYIYNSSSEELGIDKIESGRTYQLKVDVKPIMERAFGMTQDAGYMETSAWENMFLSEMNLGWEVSEISKACAEISYVSLYYED